MIMTANEARELKFIHEKWMNIAQLLNTQTLAKDSVDIGTWFQFLRSIKGIMGNFDNDMSYIACLMAKEYLMKVHRMKEMDVSLKPQSAAGFDIDESTVDGERVIGEIKTTNPYLGNDFGAQQKTMILKDINKLSGIDVKFKYFFVTERRTFEILKRKYMSRLEGTTIVLLPDALADEKSNTVKVGP